MGVDSILSLVQSTINPASASKSNQRASEIARPSFLEGGFNIGDALQIDNPLGLNLSEVIQIPGLGGVGSLVGLFTGGGNIGQKALTLGLSALGPVGAVFAGIPTLGKFLSSIFGSKPSPEELYQRAEKVTTAIGNNL